MQCLRDRCRDFTTQVGDRCVAAGVDGVREENDVGVGAGIHPEGRAGEAGVAEAADGEDHAARLGERGIDVPAEAAEVLVTDGRVARSEAGLRTFFALGDRVLLGLIGGLQLSGMMIGLFGDSHELERGLLEREVAGPAGEAVEKSLREERDIVRSGEDAGVSGDSAHAPCGGVVDRAAREHVEVGVGRGVGFRFVIVCGWSDA